MARPMIMEDIEETLLTVRNETPVGEPVPMPTRPLPNYVSIQTYVDVSFISERRQRLQGKSLVLKKADKPFRSHSIQ